MMIAILLQMWKWLDAKASSAAIRLTKWTGKSPEYVHPKHLIDDPGHRWYIPMLRSDHFVLDIGCGNGAHTLCAALYCRYAFGVDSDAQQVSIGGREAARKELGNVCLLIGSAEQPFPFPDRSFDRVMFLDVIEHLDRRDFALGEISRVLKDDGLLLLAAPNRETWWKRLQQKAGLCFYSDPDHRIEYTEDELRSELEAAAFQIQDVRPVVLDIPWTGLIDLAGGISLNVYKWLAKWKRVQVLRQPMNSVGFHVACVKKQNKVR